MCRATLQSKIEFVKPSVISQADLVIIGGGINGAGLAAQAAQAGLSVVLFEKGDFASGTSSKSTKLIHGGIRYLEQGRFNLVFEALHERRRLMELAPHLVHPVPFLLPSYKGDRRPAWMLRLGLWLYSLLAGSNNFSHHEWHSPGETTQLAPGLGSLGLKGCGLYFDAQVNDARLVLENILAAQKAGAHCYNYCRIIRIEQNVSQTSVVYQDDSSGEIGAIKASCLVNASGPWANQTAQLLSRGAQKLVRPTRGTHIVVPQVLASHAVLIAAQRDNRVIFVIPWRDCSLVGTTDLDDSQDPDRVSPTEEEIQYLLTEAARVFPDYPWKRDKILAAFAGLRPLAWIDGGHASAISREDKILRSANLLTIVGGKLTTYHAMARKTLRLVFEVLGKKPGALAEFPLPGTPNKPWTHFIGEEIPRWVSNYGIRENQGSHLAQLYGQRAVEVLEITRQNPGLKEQLHPERPELLAQVYFAVQNEMARHLEDVLLRRLEIGYTPQRWGEAPEKASHLMAELLKWDESTRQKELHLYRSRLYPPP